MTDLPTPPTDDERGPVGQLTRLFLTQLLAVIAIAAVITAVVAWTGGGLDDDITAAPSDSASPSESSDPPSASPPSTSPSPSTSSEPAASTPASSSAPATSSSAPAVDDAKVDVLNQSAGQGAAQRTADQLQAAGWRIGRVDDFRGNVSTTTVYWLTPDKRQQARQVAQDLGGVRVQEGFSTLVEGRVSVILVD